MDEQRNYWTRRRISRRAALRGVGLGVAGLAGAALIGCGDDDDEEPAAAQATAAPTQAAAETQAAAAEPQVAAPKRGGIFRQADMVTAPHFSPLHPGAAVGLSPTWRQANGYYDGLWGLRSSDDPARQFFVRLAESYEQVDDVTAVVKLRRASYHDQPAHKLNSTVGARQVDAEDFVKQFEFRLTPPASMTKRLKEDETVTAVDELTLKMELKRPYAFFTEAASMGAIPRELLDEAILKENPPIGTGPFKYKAHRVGTTEEVVRNPDYFVKDRPYLDGKILTVVPDASALESAFRSNQIEEIDFSDIKQRDSVADDLGDEIYVIDYPSASGMALIVNIRKEPFKDIRIREAIHRAIDVQRIIDVVYFGDAQRSWIFSPANPTRFPIGFDAVKQYVGFNKEKAAQLVAAAKADGGYSGREIEFMLPAESQTWIDGGRLAADDLRDVGFDIKTFTEVRNIYLQRSGPKDTKDLTKASPFDLTMSVFLSYTSFRSDTGSFWNNTGLEDPEIDAQINLVYETIDAEKRAEYSHELEILMAKKYSNFIPLLSETNHVGWYSYVKDLDLEDSRSGIGGWQIGMWFDL
jgi:ABC-type transport system substrate-binding protein